MAYDEHLADRLRELLQDEPGLTERKMFGGLGFMLHGNMAVAAGSKGGLLLRADPQQAHDLCTDQVRPAEMQGRALDAWLEVDPEAVGDDEALASYVSIGVAYVRTMPAK